MLKEIVNGALRKYGYEINNLRHQWELKDGFSQYKIVNLQGTFDHEEYRRLQDLKNKRDIEGAYVKEENIEFLAQYIKARLGTPKFGLCHGTKRGLEQQWFIKYLQCEVLGTEIADTATQFPHTIQWDFHEVKPEWLGAVDFIYSNALDHSYDPEKAINAWMSCIRPDGFTIVEWHNGGESLSITDPFSADIIQLVYGITRWGNGVYSVREVIPTPGRGKYVSFIIIHKFREL